MNEFTDKTKDQLDKFRLCLESYNLGALSTLEIIEDFIKNLSKKMKVLYKEKIRLCEKEIMKMKDNYEAN